MPSSSPAAAVAEIGRSVVAAGITTNDHDQGGGTTVLLLPGLLKAFTPGA